MNVIKELLPNELISCFRASFQKEDTFFSTIPYLVEKGASDKIERRVPVINVEFEKINKINIYFMPDDALVNVFSFLDCRTILSLSLVCPLYYHLSHDDRIWKPYIEILESKKITIELRDKLNEFYHKTLEEKMYESWKTNGGVEIEENETYHDGEDDTETLSERTEVDEDSKPAFQMIDKKVLLFEWKSPHAKKQIELSPYLEFRKQKLLIPYIRRKLIRIYGDQMKSSYFKWTKWINLAKALTCTLITLFLVLMAVKLDSYIPWPWLLIYFPLAVASIPQLILVILFWLPTLNWPLVFYRWIFQDYVGWWSSWAYSLTVRGRFVQLVFGINFTLAFLVGYFATVFPTIVPAWAPVVLHAAGFLFWTTTFSQIKYPQRRWFYIFFFVALTLCLTAFCIMIFLKMFFFPMDLTWVITFIPFYAAMILFVPIMIKANIDMNHSSLFLHHVVWNLQFLGLFSVFTMGVIFVVLRLDNIWTIQWAIVLIPFFVLMIILNVFYYLKAMTSWIKRSVYKNPFTLIGGGTKNNAQMNVYVV